MLLGCNGCTRQFQGQMGSLGSCWREQCSIQLRLGMLRVVQPSSAPCEREQQLPQPQPCWAAWLRALHTGAGGKGKGKLGETLFLMLSPRNSPFNLLPQVQWKEIHFQHGDSGGDLTDWICLGSRICKKSGIRVGMWYQWDHPCPRRREGCIGRCCLSLP